MVKHNYNLLNKRILALCLLLIGALVVLLMHVGSAFASRPRETRIYFGGQFQYQNLDLNNVGYYSIVSPYQKNLNSMGGGTDGPVKVIKMDPMGNVYIGGSFTTVGSLKTGPIAAYNVYQEKWVPIGLNNSQFSHGSTVNAISFLCKSSVKVTEGLAPCDVYVGGTFSVSLNETIVKNLMSYSFADSKWKEFNLLPIMNPKIQIDIDLLLKDSVKSMSVSRETPERPVTWLDVICSTGWIRFFSDDQMSWYFAVNVGFLNFGSFIETYATSNRTMILSESYLDLFEATTQTQFSVSKINKIRGDSNGIYMAGENPKPIYCKSPQTCYYLNDPYNQFLPPHPVLAMDLADENSDRPGSLVVGGDRFLWVYNPNNPYGYYWTDISFNYGPCIIMDVVMDANACFENMFGDECQNKVKLQSTILSFPSRFTVSDPLEITDGKKYHALWTFNNQIFNTSSLTIYNPAKTLNCEGCNSFYLKYKVYNSDGKQVYEKSVNFYITQILRTLVTYIGGLNFKIERPSEIKDGSNICSVGFVTEKPASLKELLLNSQNNAYSTYNISCDGTSIIKVPYLGVDYTLLHFTLQNADYQYSDFSDRIVYFPTFFANIGNGTETHVTTDNDTLSFSSAIHSNIPVLRCRADLILYNSSSIKIYDSNCTSTMNFTYKLPAYTVNNASLVITLSNDEYYYEEIEHFDIELPICNLACQNGGSCRKSTNGLAFCECNGNFVGDYCEYCKEGFIKQSGKCVCNSGYQQIGDTCVKGNSDSDTSCFGMNRTDILVCNGKGNCTSFNLCNCYNGFTGIDCSLPICFGQAENPCNGNGNCIAPDTCNCNDKFGGMTCTIPKCNGLLETEGACSFHGSCNANNLCECGGNFAGLKCSVCKEGFTGAKCDIPICSGISGIDSKVCGGNGKCQAPDTCQCHDNYYGPNCASFKCNGIEKTDSKVCSSNGFCTSVDTCSCSNSNYDPASFCSKCLPAFNGTDCSTRTCSSETTCHSNGICNDKQECSCSGNFGGKYCEKCIDGWVGLNCDIVCNSKTTCSGKGTCSSTGACICSATSYGDHCENCKDGWYGENCDYSINFSSFEFNENGDVITGTVYSGYKKNIDCFSLLTNAGILGQYPTCLLDGDKNLLTINLGSSATIVIEDKLNMRVSIDSQSTRNATVFGTFYKRTYPSAFLTSEKSVIGCGNMFLDASSSSSLDRRRLRFTFSATLAPNDQSLAILSSLISGFSSSTVKFPVDNLSSGTYSVQVSVQSSFSGRISYASYSFTVTDSSPPNLNIKNGLSSVATIGNSFAITPIVSFPSCYKGTPAISSLNFNYTQLSGPSLQIKQMNELLVFSSDFTKIREEGKYSFNLKARQDGYPEASINFEINAIALPLKVSFNIRDMSISMEDNIKFTILKQDPSNTEESGERVVLSCTNLETSQDCGVINIDQSTLTFDEKYTPGNYLFTATYSKGSRSSSSKIRITVTNQSKSSFLRVYIASSSADLTAVDPSSSLILQAQSLDSLSSQRTYQWSANFDSSTIDSNKKYFSIPTSSLVPGASYTVSVKIVDQSRVGESSISFIVNSPPTLGALDINPSTGAALVDEFQISCGNGWSDSQLPLSFKFLSRQKGETFWKVLKEKSETRSFSTFLPSGSLEIKAVVYDSLGAFTETIQTIQVSTPTMDISSAVKSLNSLSASSVTSSSASTALSVIQSLKPQTEEEKQNLIETGSKIALAFFAQIDKEEKSTQQTVSSTSSSISVISTISTCIENLPESTIGVTITKFKSTVDGANSKLVLPSEDIESSFSSAVTIQSHVLKNKARAISLFSQDQVKTLDQVKESLVNLKLKNFVPDMPAARTFGSDYYAYVRLMSVSSLSGLNETVNSVSSFSLSQSFDSLTEVSNLETVKMYMKVQNWENSITKLFTFKVLSGDSEIMVKSVSGSSIAQLVIETNQGAQTADYYDCNALQNGELNSTDSCQIVSSSATVFTVQVSSTGSYAIQARKEYEVIVSTTMDMLKYVALVTLIVPIILVALIVVFVIICCVRRKRKQAKQQLIQGTV